MNDRFYHAADFSGEKISRDTNLFVAAAAIKKIGQPASEEFKKLASRPLPGNTPGQSRFEIKAGTVRYAVCQGGAAIPGGECRRRLAASSIAGHKLFG